MIRTAIILCVCGLLSNVHCRAGVIKDPTFSNVAANWNPVGATSALGVDYPFADPAPGEMLVSPGNSNNPGFKKSSISQVISVEAGDTLSFNWSAVLYIDGNIKDYATVAYWSFGGIRNELVSLADPNIAADNVVSVTFSTNVDGLLEFGIEQTRETTNLADFQFSTLTIDALFITPSQSNNNPIPEPSSVFCFSTLFAALGFFRTRRSAKV